MLWKICLFCFMFANNRVVLPQTKKNYVIKLINQLIYRFFIYNIVVVVVVAL